MTIFKSCIIMEWPQSPARTTGVIIPGFFQDEKQQEKSNRRVCLTN